MINSMVYHHAVDLDHICFPIDVRTLSVLVSQVQELSELGGKDVNAAVRAILNYLMTDEVAEKYNWEGRGQKSSFSKLNLLGLIHSTIKINRKIQGSTKLDVKGAIVSWLRHAKERRTKGRQASTQITSESLTDSEMSD
ncbi:uncharacterized protein LOC135373170 [Ornithodoros turicata]|uniref:uncharacterized protein LOC135373170 n=1 Tax=Ornithodoros turicata TaxID=34597 RepID=UPI003138788F